MSDDDLDSKKLPVRRSGMALSRPTLGDLPTTLPNDSGAFPWSKKYKTTKDAEFVEAHTRLLIARGKQSDALNDLVDKRIALGAKLADLHNVLAEQQRVRDHDRWQAERKRQHDRMQADYDDLLAVTRNETEVDRAREAAIRAQRNRDATSRIKQSEIDAWAHAAEARRNNALAESQDTAADLARTPAAAAPESAMQQTADSQRAHMVAVLDSQIDLERQRGNEAAVLALLNLRARLSAR
jgi:hypothetical protein